MAIGDVVAYSNLVDVPGMQSIIHDDALNQATYGNHIELSSSIIMAVYNDVTNSKGMVRLGTRVSDFCIEWGTAVEFYNGSGGYYIPVRVSDTKFLIVYRDASGNGASIAGTVSGTVPTLGTPVTFNASTTTPIGAVLMDADKVMIAFANGTTNGQAVIASLTGTTIAYGAIATFKATTDITGYMTLTQLCAHSTTLASVVYRVSATVTQVVTLSLSGTTITPNTAGLAAFGGSANIQFPSICALSATAFVLAYTDVTDSNKGNTQVGTISGTTITAGASEYSFDATNYATRVPSIVAMSSTMFAIVYKLSATVGYVSLGSVASTVVTMLGALQVSFAETSVQYYPSPGSTYINLSYTKAGQLTFSYMMNTSYGNQFVCGMFRQDGTAIAYEPMRYRIATATATEQLELSSIYLKSNYQSFTAAYPCMLYINGTLAANEFYRYPDTANGATADTLKTKVIPPPGSGPIIVPVNQSLYAAYYEQYQPNNVIRGSSLVNGLKRTVA